jgi:hypothetical protein
MRRLATALAALLFAVSLSTGALADKPDKHGNAMNAPGHMMAPGQMRKRGCPPGQHWVKGYTKKNGQKVKGYCR